MGLCIAQFENFTLAFGKLYVGLHNLILNELRFLSNGEEDRCSLPLWGLAVVSSADQPASSLVHAMVFILLNSGLHRHGYPKAIAESRHAAHRGLYTSRSNHTLPLPAQFLTQNAEVSDRQ